MEQVTTETIIEFLEDAVRKKKVLSPHVYMDAAHKLTILLGEEQDNLYELQSGLAKMKAAYIAEGDTSAAANAKIEAEDGYLEMQKQKGKLKQIVEFIRISKTRAKLKDEEWGMQ